MIQKEIIREVIERNDILSIIREYVPLRKRGRNYIGLCPFHSEKTPSFTVSPEKHLWHCFGCNEGGNIVTFLMKIENSTFIDTVKQLAERAGVTIQEDLADTLRSPLFEVTERATFFYHSLIQKEEGKNAHSYLVSRGFNDNSIRELKVGFAPRQGNALVQFLIKAGYDRALILEAGLAIQKDDGSICDRFRNRVMFPICNANGDTIAFGGRVLPGDDNKNIAKYINSPENDIYHKGKTLYGLHLTRDQIRKTKEAFVVEGYMDWISCYLNGITNVVATLGTAMTPTQARMIKNYASEVILGYDSDQAGTEASIRAASMLIDLGAAVKVAAFSRKDPDEVIRQDGVEALKEQIRQAIPFLMFNIDKLVAKYDLGKAESVNKLVNEAIQFLATIDDPVLINEYVKYLAGRAKVSEESIVSKLKQIKFYRSRGLRNQAKLTQPPRSDKYKKAQEIVISFLVKGDDQRQVILEQLNEDDFIDPELKEIFGIIKKTGNDGLYSNDFIANENLGKRLRNIIMLDETEEVIALKDCITILKSEYKYETRKKEIEAGIKDAETANDKAKLLSLLEAYNQLIKERYV